MREVGRDRDWKMGVVLGMDWGEAYWRKSWRAVYEMVGLLRWRMKTEDLA